MRLLIIFTILALYSFSAVYPQLSVKATVLDEKSAPIPYATVYNNNTRRGVITNEEGRFELEAEPNDVIVVKCLGYQEYKNTSEQIQNAGVINLKEAIYTLDEVVISPNTDDAKSIIKKFRFRIPSNYPRKAAQINGVYKSYSLVENEYATFFQCDMDILINSIAAIRQPSFQTKVYDYKSFRQLDSVTTWHLNPESSYNLFCPNYFRFLWDFTKYQFRHIGVTTYNESKLIGINFYPSQIDKSKQQYTGTMYISMKTYALVFLHLEMLPNEMDFRFSDRGFWFKSIKDEIKIMYYYKDKYYYPAYVIRKYSGKVSVSDRDAKPKYEDAIDLAHVYNFFTKKVEYNPKVFIPDGFSIEQLIIKNVLNKTDYKSDFILETEQEKQLMLQ